MCLRVLPACMYVYHVLKRQNGDCTVSPLLYGLQRMHVRMCARVPGRTWRLETPLFETESLWCLLLCVHTAGLWATPSHCRNKWGCRRACPGQLYVTPGSHQKPLRQDLYLPSSLPGSELSPQFSIYYLWGLRIRNFIIFFYKAAVPSRLKMLTDKHLLSCTYTLRVYIGGKDSFPGRCCCITVC